MDIRKVMWWLSAQLWITSLNSHFPVLKLSPRCWKEKSGAKNSAFS